MNAPRAGELVGTGDFVFYLDGAAFRGVGDRVLYETYLRIPNNEIAFRERDNTFSSRVKISVKIADFRGTPVIEDSETLTFTEASKENVKSSLNFQTVIKPYLIQPGVYSLSYAVEDLEAPKVNMLAMVRGKNKVSLVRDVRVDVPEIPEEEPSFSQPKFVWSIDRAGDKTVYHPNPPRMYGLYKDTLFVYLELYLPDSLAQEPTFEFKSYLLNADGEAMTESVASIPNPETPGAPQADNGRRLRTYPVVIREDLTSFPAGAYSLTFSFGLGNRTLSRLRGGGFSVAWDMRTWEVPRRNYHSEARFLLGDKEYSVFATKSLGEQEQMLDKLWKELDPAPETGVNEAREKFLVRLAYVYDRFGDANAVFSPRGSVYLKWGPPDDIIQDVVPSNRESLAEVVEIIENKFHGMNYSTHGVKLGSRSNARNRIVDPREISRVGEGGNVGYPFELWIYETAGDPILERDRVLEADMGVRLLFVDREGYGRYQLESSSSISAK